jgi:LysM repeat protein
MKTNPNPEREAKSGFNPHKFRRHYVSAVESDELNISEEEKSNLGRIFTFLLLLHVFLIGAVVLYNLVAEKPAIDTATSVASVTKPGGKAKAITAPNYNDPNAETYVVKAGQNLQDISAATGASKEEIISMNHLDENGELFVGRKLMVPKRQAPVPAALPVPAAKVEELEMIAAAAEVESDKKGSAENIEPAKQDLPSAVTPKAKELVQDQLPEDKSNSSKPAAGPAIKDKPPETKPVAKVDPPVTKPTPKPAPAVKPKEVTKPVVAKKGGTHEVKPKETFYSIARRYGVSVDELMKVNGIKNANALRNGTKLKIP